MAEPILVIARAQVRPDSRERFLAAAHACIAATRAEHGCLAYDLHESVTQPGRFVMVESWEERRLVDRHMEAAHTRAFLAVAGACVTTAPVIEVVEPRSVDRV